MTTLTQDTCPLDHKKIVRRYVDGRLEAERGSDYSLGSPPITDDEYRGCHVPQRVFEALEGKR